MENCTHFSIDRKGYNWKTLPFLWVKYNIEELPLIYFIKELIDDINYQESITADVLRDVVNFIYIIKNYGGTDLKEFLSDLQKYKAVKVDESGGIDKLQADLDIQAVLQFLDKHRRDIYDYARSVDTQDPNLGDASGKALKLRYMDLDMDINDLEAEFQFAFEKLKPFIDDVLNVSGKGSFYNYDFDVAFKRDAIVNETEIIENIAKSPYLSLETQLSKHPWVEDVTAEMKKIEAEQPKDAYADAFLSERDNYEQ